MPPLTRLSLPVLVELSAQLRYAPADVVRRAIDRSELLASQVDESGQYPAEWIVYWITRYRPEALGAVTEGNIRGADLLAELSAFTERLCDAAKLTQSELRSPDSDASIPPPATDAPLFLTPQELADRWGVSRKTIDRCRRKGLVARRALGPRGKPRVLFNLSAAEAFRQRHAQAITKAAGYTRIDPTTHASILRRAQRYRRRFGCSLNQAAARLAQRFDRSHETIRQLLQRHDAQQKSAAQRARKSVPHAIPHAPPQLPAPVFGDAVPMSPRDRRVAYRAWRRALEPADIARHLRHRKAAILRGVLLERLDTLRRILPSLSAHVGPTFGLPDSDKAILGPAPVRTDLGRLPERDLASFLTAARVRVVPVGAEEIARAVAYHFLRWRSAGAIHAIDHLHPSAAAIDAIETDLRWAARLKAQLLRSQFPLMIQTLEGRLETRIDSLRPADGVGIILAALTALSDAVDAFDPFRAVTSGGRMAGAVSPAITRIAAQWARAAAPSAPRSRATAVYSLTAPLPDFTRTLCPWQSFLEPDHRLRDTLPRVPADAADFLRRRYGWDGGPPTTLARLSRDLGLTPMRTGIAERSHLRAALTLARTPTSPA